MIGHEDDHGTVELTALIQIVDEPTDVQIEVLDHGCVEFLRAGISAPLVCGQFRPRGRDRLEVIQYGARWNHADFRRSCDSRLAQLVIARIVAARVVVQPILWHLQRQVGRGVGRICEPGRGTVMVLKELDQLVGVVIRRVEILWQVLVRNAHAIEFVETRIAEKRLGKVAGQGCELNERAVESARGRRVGRFKSQVPFAGRISRVARILQQLRQTRPVETQAHRTQTDIEPLPGLQRCGSTGAGHQHHPRLHAAPVRVEVREPDAAECKLVEVWRGNFAPKCAYVRVTQVVGHDQENVGALIRLVPTGLSLNSGWNRERSR